MSQTDSGLHIVDGDERNRNAFGWLPNAVIREPRVSARLLTLMAYRCTFADKQRDWGLRKEDAKRRLRIGGGSFYWELRSAKKLGMWERRQTVGRDKAGRSIPGRYSRSIDRLRLPYANQQNQREDAQHVRREWFDNSLRPEEVAVLLLVMSGTSKGPVFAGEVAQRFDWSERTAAKYLNALQAQGLVAPVAATRGSDGRFKSPQYAYVKGSLSRESEFRSEGEFHRLRTLQKNTGDGKPGDDISADEKPADIRISSSHVHPSDDNSHVLSAREEHGRTFQEVYTGRAPPEPMPTISKHDIVAKAWSSPILLAWTLEGAEEVLAEFLDAAPHEISDIETTIPDDDLRLAIRTATQDRVHKDILGPSGLYAVRVLAACLLEKGDGNVAPHQALDCVLEAIRHRIGDRPGERLNSLAFLGKRLAGQLYSGEWIPSDTFYRNGDAPVPHKHQPLEGTPIILALIEEIFAVDGAHVLSENLKCGRQQHFLRKRVKDYGAELTRTTIKGLVYRHMIDGGAIGKIKDWRYFDGALDDACRTAQMEAMGSRPGDFFGMHRAAMKAERGG